MHRADAIEESDKRVRCALGIVVINFRTPALVKNCLASLGPELEAVDARVAIVDNCSNAGSAEEIASWLTTGELWKGRVFLIRSPSNEGFSGGNNIGIKAFDAAHYLLRMESNPEWTPDFGPHRLHPTAGATVIGARRILVAFNVNLGTNDLGVAKAIAKAVRQSSGGLAHVKAIGVPLASRNLVQVSMNLVNIDETPVHVAFEAVRWEAGRRRVQVTGSELIGLVPRQAVAQAPTAGIQIDSFDPSQILETRLEQAGLGGA